MRGQSKAKLIVFFIVAIAAFALSSIAASIFIIENPNDNTLLAIEDDNFTAQEVNYIPTYIPEQKVINDTANLTNNDTNETNITEIINDTKENLTNLWNNYSSW